MTRTLDGVQSRVCVGGVLGNTFVLFLIYCVLFSLNNCIPSVEASRTRMCVCVCMCVTTEWSIHFCSSSKILFNVQSILQAAVTQHVEYTVIAKKSSVICRNICAHAHTHTLQSDILVSLFLHREQTQACTYSDNVQNERVSQLKSKTMKMRNRSWMQFQLCRGYIFWWLTEVGSILIL